MIKILDKPIENIVNDLFNKIEKIENLTWKQLWNKTPRNLNGEKFKDINMISLNLKSEENSFEKNIWGTSLQIKNLGGKIKENEKGTQISFYHMIDKRDFETGNKTGEKIPYLKKFTVYNIEQTTLREKDLSLNTIYKEDPEKILQAYIKNQKIEVVKGKDIYYNKEDKISLPKREFFADIDGFYSVAFNKIIKSTSHKNRLSRNIDKTNPIEFSKEEIIAAFGTSILLNNCGIENKDIEKNYLSKIKKELKNIKSTGDKTFLLRAAKEGRNAAEYIINIVNIELNKEKNEKIIEIENNIPENKTVVLENTNGKRLYIEQRYINGEKQIRAAEKENVFDLGVAPTFPTKPTLRN